MNNDSVKDVLRKMIDDNGIEILNDKRYCMAMIKDLAPNDRQGIEDVQWAFSINLPNKFVMAKNESLIEQQSLINKTYNNLTATFNCITLKRMLELLIFAVRWNVIVPQTQNTSSTPNISKSNSSKKKRSTKSNSSQNNNSQVPTSSLQNNNTTAKSPPTPINTSYPVKTSFSKEKVFLLLFLLITLILFAFVVIPKINNQKSKNENNIQETNSSGIMYLGKDIISSECGYDYKEYSGNPESTFSMGGIFFDTGFTIGTNPERGYAIYDLEGKYLYINGKAGNLDNKDVNVSYVFYGDGEIIGIIDIKGEALPIDFSFSIEGVNQLKIVGDSSETNPNAIGFANVAVSNAAFVTEKTTSEIKSAVSYLGKDISAYTKHDYKEIDADNPLSLGGFYYYNGFTLGTTDSSPYAIFNVDGKFTHFSGIAGNMDHRTNVVSCSYSVYGDDILIGNINIIPNALPIEYDFDITNVKQLKIAVAEDSPNSANVCFANAVLYNDINYKPDLFATSNYPPKAYLGKDIKAYQNKYHYKECDADGENVSIQGNKFYNGFIMGITPNSGGAYYNLNSEYNKLSGKIGFSGEFNGIPVSYGIYADGNYIGNIDVSVNEIKNFNFDVSGVKQLLIKAEVQQAWDNEVSFADVVVSKE